MTTAKSRSAAAAARAPETAGEPESFEAALHELEALVRQMGEGSLPLEASVDAYRRGSGLVRYCSQQLERVEQQIQVLDGEMLKPFEPKSQE